MSFYVYMLRCSDNSFYIGHTDNLEQRYQEHQRGFFSGCYTFNRRPLTLVYHSTFSSREEALSSERQLKGWSRAKKEALINNDWESIKRLAKSHPSTTPSFSSFDS